MTSVQEVIASSDSEKIRGRRTACKRMLSILKKQIEIKLVKSESNPEEFDHAKIERKKVKDDYSKVDRYYKDFEELHFAFLSFRPEDADEVEEKKLSEKDDNYYEEVIAVAQELIQISDQYEASYRLYEDTKPDPSKEKLDEEAKATAAQEGAVKQVEVIIVKQRAFDRAWAVYSTHKKEAAEMVKHAEGLEFAAMVKSEFIRGLPVFDAKDDLVKNLDAVTNAADDLLAALEAQMGVGKAQDKIRFDQPQEYISAMELKGRLHLMLSARMEYNTSGRQSSVPQGQAAAKPAAIKIKLPAVKFSGLPRDFASFKKEFQEIVVPGRLDAEIGAFLRDAIPEKHRHLLRNLDLNNHAEAMEILHEEFGKPEHVMNWVVGELSSMKPVTTDKLFVEFVDRVEKIYRDLEAVSMKKDLMNARMISDIVTKFPPVIAQKWAEIKVKNKVGDQSSEKHFEEMYSFMLEYKKVTKNLNPEHQSASTTASTRFCFVTGQTLVTQQPQPSNMKSCLVCEGSRNPREAQHWTSTCEKWRNMNLTERRKVVKCWRHPFDTHTYANCRGAKMKRFENGGKPGFQCSICGQNNHCAELCSQNKAVTKLARSHTIVATTPLPPVLLQTNCINSINGIKLGAMWDLCSTDDYITFSKAEQLGLQGREVMLTVEGIRGVEETISTKIYDVPLFTRKGKKRVYQCYGMETIASAADPPEEGSYREMCIRFNVSMHEVERPRQIDILISMRHNQDHPKAISSRGDMTLWEGVFGKLFGGVHVGLKFLPHVLSCHIKSRQRGCLYSTTLRAMARAVTEVSSVRGDRDLLNHFEEDSIGVDARPKCGGCSCGQCMVKAHPMSLRMETAYEEFKTNLVYLPEGLPGDEGPFFQTTYKWDIPKEQLVPNYPAVKATFHRTKKQLQKDPSFEPVYDKQLKDLIDMGVARELHEGELDEWIALGKPYYYIAHQVVINEGNKSTPVRVVFNSSQKFAGFSLNKSWDLGPDVMANLQAVLLRFRSDVVGAQGDIRKMFYMIRVTREEEMMQLWIWKFKGEDKIRTFAMTRLVMGNKPSTNISIVAVRETANLFDFKQQYPEAHATLVNDTYVDNVFLTAPDLENLLKKIQEIEVIAAAGGFKFKEWLVPGVDTKADHIVAVASSDVEKALGMYWDVSKDEFFVRLNLSSAEKEMLPDDGAGRNAVQHPIHQTLKPKLTIRIGLSFHAKVFDPLGLVLPTRLIGMLLFRSSLQALKKELKGRIPWDEHLEGEILTQWLQYFDMLLRLDKFKFKRSFKPENWDPSINPDLVTFSDGNPDAFGTVAYALWTLQDGSKKARLIGSKAKLAPLLKKGETVRNELNGATFSARFKSWIYEQSGITFNHHYPIVDSRIVQDMVKKDSYSLDTFTGLRVSEIQKKTVAEDWIHVPSKENVADVLTKGATPESLGPASVWQSGPGWLVDHPSTWPVTDVQADPLSADSLKPFLVVKKKSKVFTSIIKDVDIFDLERKVAGSGLTDPGGVQAMTKITSSKRLDLLELLKIKSEGFDKLVARFSDLPKLIRTMAYLLRCALSKRSSGGTSAVGRIHATCMGMSEDDVKRFIKEKVPEISAKEYNDAWLVIIALEQSLRLKEKDVKKLVPSKIYIKLATYDWTIQHVVLGGRVSNFPIGFGNEEKIPIIPYGPLARLVLLHYHDKHHRDMDTVVAMARRDVWVVKARKLAAEWDNKCRICLEKRKKLAGQIMGDAPDFKTEVKPAWTSVNMDLFGPFLIKDDCVKKGPKTKKKVYGVLYTCTLTRGIYLDIATAYDTQAVIHTVRRLMAAKGNVRLLISDPGSQLKGANKEMSTWRKGWDERLLVRFGADKGLEWKFIMPSSQHQNGAAEIMIKMVKGVKRSLLKALGNQILNLNEMNTLMAEIAQLVNERPIGLKPNASTHPHYLSPNSLYLGRCSDRIAAGPFEPDEVFTDDPHQARSRFLLVQAITAQFWKIWIRDFFPTLLVRHKWHVRQRNLMVDDVCLLKDQDAFRSEWKLARVVEVYPDRFGNVRNVEVLVKPAEDGSIIYKPSGGQLIKRHVSNLLLLVPVEDQNAYQAKYCADEVQVQGDVEQETAELVDAGGHDEDKNRCASSNFRGFETRSNMCKVLQEPGSTPSPRAYPGASASMPAGCKGDWYQVPLMLEDEAIARTTEDDSKGDRGVKLRGCLHEEFPQVEEAEVLHGLEKFWGDC